MPNTWNQSGTTWNQGRWGTQDPIVTGWGAKSYNEPGTSWNDLGDQLVELTSPGGNTLSIGSVSVTAEINTGWGQDGWGVENYGQSGLVVEVEAPSTQIVASVSANAWNDASFGQGQGWGIFALAVADVMGLTGVSSTSGVGSTSIQVDFSGTVTGVSATSSVGSLSPADVMGLTGVSSTSAVGTLTPADVMGLTGVSSTSSVGSISINSSPLVALSGVSATSAVGTLSPADVLGS